MRVRRRGRRRRGGAMVEMAILLPIFVMLIFGQLEASRAGMVAQMLANAAREGCRLAAMPDTTGAGQVTDRVNQVLNGTGISFNSVTPTPSNWATAPLGTPITVSLTADYSRLTWGRPLYLNIQSMTA